jgi:hypothetical protein
MMRKLLVAAVCLAGLAPALYADYQASFRNGITAIDRRRWSEAAAAMRAAIAENPTEGSKKVFIYGTRYVEYTPHYYLGLALSRSNNCGEAVPALRQSEQQGVITRTSSYKDLKAILAACGASDAPAIRNDPAPPPVVQTQPDPKPAYVEPAVTPAPVVPQRPTPAPVVPQNVPPAADPIVRPQATATTTTVAPVAPRPDPALIASRQKLAKLVTDSRKLLNEPRSERSAKSRDALTRAINAAATASNSDSTQTIQTATNTLSGAADDFRRMSDTTPGLSDRQLADAVRAYLRGDYDRTATLLEGLTFDSPKARAQAALFRAAANYARFTLAGGKDEILRTQAIAELRQYRRMESAAPDARVFSPPFRKLYAEVR